MNLNCLKIPKFVNNHGKTPNLKNLESAPRGPNLKIRGKFVSNSACQTIFCKYFIIYFREAKIMGGRKYSTFLASILLNVEVYKAEPTRGRDLLPQIFSTKS